MNAKATRTQSTSRPSLILGPGRSVSIRPIDAGDAAGLSDFYAKLSPESRHRRFLGACSGLSPAQAAAFARRGAGFVAILHEPGLNDGATVGHALVADIPGAGDEIAFAVADHLQGRGIGRALMHEVLASARRRLEPGLVAWVVADNVPMHRLLETAGLPLESRGVDGGVEELELRLSR
jgi:GNAT superfamily N-acetyltransferase